MSNPRGGRAGLIRVAVFSLAIVAFAAGCKSQATRAVGVELDDGFRNVIRPAAERGLQARIQARELTDDEAAVIRRTFDGHQTLIDRVKK